MSELNAFVDNLEAAEEFVPDLMILDYADLMKMGSTKDTDHRIEVGKIYKELRGFAVARNIMLATASQVNRAGAAAQGKIDITHISEDFSKIQTCDTAIMVSATEAQRNAGIARLFVGVARNAEDKFEVLIEQDYL